MVKRLSKMGDLGSIPGSGRIPGEGNSNPLQYSCLGNPMDGGKKNSQVTERKKKPCICIFEFTVSSLIYNL